jgi:hypothetical protein
LALTWIEQQLAESGLSIEQLVRSGNQQQAADQVSISNSIGSLRLLGTMDWRELVEATSVVERTLRTDPGTAYAAMDFASRDRYRHVIEEVAKASGLGEVDVANRAIGLAQADAARHGSQDRTAHVGYYLIDQGRSELEDATRARPRLTLHDTRVAPDEEDTGVMQGLGKGDKEHLRRFLRSPRGFGARPGDLACCRTWARSR